MRFLVIAGLLLASFTHSKAQSGFNLSEKGCATVTTPQEMEAITDYVNNPQVRAKTTSGVDSIPLSIHIVSRDNGTGRYRLDYLLSVLCSLNTRYAPVGFYFYLKGPVKFIKNTSYYIHDYSNGAQMMYQNNVPNSTNIYFVSDPNGACGYYAHGPEAIAIGINCALPNNTTVTHEIGHYFGLPHTFSGWENGNTPSNPEKVTRGLGANCSSAGDNFCDTEADYLGARWQCPYTGTKTDANGQLYKPYPTLYMSYSDDACMTRFSNQQIGYMQNRLVTNRSYLLNANSPTGNANIDTNINVIYPTNLLYSNRKTVSWNKVAGAQYYYVKAGLQLGSAIRQDTITADTSLTLYFPMVDNGTYSVTVIPISDINLCMKAQKRVVFTYTSATTSVPTVGSENSALTIYPNPANNNVTLKLNAKAGSYNVQISNVSGQKVYHQLMIVQSASSQLSVPTGNLPNGLYMIRVSGDNATWTEKLMVQH
ncbi:MAG TPA: zinc-dependent metalloprotease [Flavipsychrobacter sp.]|nr:zinc-dependent metalloprotease [Flavipsychrobacter sp.]